MFSMLRNSAATPVILAMLGGTALAGTASTTPLAGTYAGVATTQGGLTPAATGSVCPDYIIAYAPPTNNLYFGYPGAGATGATINQISTTSYYPLPLGPGPVILGHGGEARHDGTGSGETGSPTSDPSIAYPIPIRFPVAPVIYTTSLPAMPTASGVTATGAYTLTTSTLPSPVASTGGSPAVIPAPVTGTAAITLTYVNARSFFASIGYTVNGCTQNFTYAFTYTGH
jgi:hypothetical protein